MLWNDFYWKSIQDFACFQIKTGLKFDEEWSVLQMQD